MHRLGQSAFSISISANNFAFVRGVATLRPKVRAFVDNLAALAGPDKVHVCNGTQQEYDSLLKGLIAAGTVQPLNQEKRPGCYIAWTDPADVARAEKDTFICSKEKDSGPTNNWVSSEKKKSELHQLFRGCMQGRTMYVVPFSMGPLNSPLSKIGIQVTDSAYVAASMRIMTRMGENVLKQLGDGDFVSCIHSVGQPIKEGDSHSADYKSARSFWPCNIKHRNVCHFPDSREIWSFGSGYGGNSLLGKKCFALRIASVQARDEGWLAEHMLILGITNPQGEKRYVAAAFPSACGKTNLAMMRPSLPGWKIETVGDDICWMKPGADGRLHAINPEFGFFGVAPGTSRHSNPNAMETCQKNSLFTNVGLTEDGDVYWEGMEEIPTNAITDWRRRKHWLPTLRPTFKGPGSGHKGSGYKIDEKTDPAAQANSRFTSPVTQCPVLDPNWDSATGVPIDAIIFGGRRDDTLPLVFQSFNWQHGTFIGSIMRSQATSAADQVGLTNDPMAMKAFCGYNIKDYFAHWLSFNSRQGLKLPKIFHVNWFQKDPAGRFIWPGFGENIRVLEWIFNRCGGNGTAVETPIGYLPELASFNSKGLSVSPADLKHLFHIDRKLWLRETEAAAAYYHKTLMPADSPLDEPHVPKALEQELAALVKRLG